MTDMSFYHNHKIKFEVLDSVNNPKSIHGIYPYRGKISALDAAQIIKQLPKNATLLDPFCGSGTIVYEAQKFGLNAIGFDMNPLAIDLSRGKISTHLKKDEIINQCEELINRAKKLNHDDVPIMPLDALKSFHIETSKEIMRVSTFINEMCDYVKSAYYGSIALTARGCNHYMWTSSTVGKNIEPKNYINFYDKFIQKCKKHLYLNYGCPEAKIFHADARSLSDYIPNKSIDVVFSSPPYFDALDYTAYYGKLIYDIHKVNRLEIKENLIQRVNDYYESMQKVLSEIEKVTTDEAIIIFVVGDKKSKGTLISGGQYFADLHSRKPSYIQEREYVGSSSQVFDTLNKTHRKEQIIVWDKQINSQDVLSQSTLFDFIDNEQKL